MSSTAAPVAHAYDELSALHRQVFVVGNAGDEILERQVFGFFYRWQPGEEKSIGDQMDYPRDPKGNIPRDEFTKAIRVPASVVKVQALDIVKVLFSEEDGFRGGDVGLYLLRGDGNDAARRAMGRDSYVGNRVRIAEREKAEHAARVAAWKPGDNPIVASPRLRANLAFLVAHMSGLASRAAFWSKFGDFESDDRDAVVAYLQVTWPEQWDDQGDRLVVSRDALAPKPQAIVAKPRPSEVMTAGLTKEAARAAPEPSKQAKEQIQWLIAEAGDLGSPLTFEELQAAMSGDEAATMAIVERLATLKSQKAED